MKIPTKTVKGNAEHLEMKCFGKILYQIVKAQAKDWDNYYNMGSYSNTQWLDKQPYFLDPMKSMTNRKQHQPRQQPQGQYANPFAPNPTPWPNYYPYASTLHAIPFSRDNIKPQSFTVIKQTASLENQLCVFVNFPNGIPMIIG